MLKQVKTAAQRFRFRGWTGIAEILRHNLFCHKDFVRLRAELSGEIPHPLSPGDLEVRHNDMKTLEEFRNRPAGSLSNDFYVDQLYEASSFYLGLWDGKVAHISWVFTAKDSTLDIDLGEDEVEIRHVFTLPPFRGRGVFPGVLSSMLADLQQQGIRRAFAHVWSRNEVSLGIFRSRGFEPVARLSALRVLGYDFVREAAIRNEDSRETSRPA